MTTSSNIHTSICVVARPHWPVGVGRALQSIVDKTSNKNSIEVLVKIAHDSCKETFRVVRSFEDKLPLKIFILDGVWRREGVDDYWNVLAWNSTGKLIWHWSDELRIITEGWDSISKTYADKIPDGLPWTLYPTVCTNGGPPARCHTGYPILTRAFVEVTGRATYHVCLDSWAEFISGPLREYVLLTMKGRNAGEDFETIARFKNYPITVADDGYAIIPGETLNLPENIEEGDHSCFWELRGGISRKDLNEPDLQTIVKKVTEQTLNVFKKRFTGVFI
jgi:hypothetical protein